MITELLLIAAVGVYDPMDMSGHQMYPSGFLEVDKYPKYAPPQSKLAKLSLPRDIISSDGEVIKAGHYLISLSLSKNEILFFDGTKALYTIKVSNLDYGYKYLKISTAEFSNENINQGIILLKQGKIRAEATVDFAKNH
ncbi:MAG: hypothetical protein MJ180_04750 [Candidatus Gastranaerophilales bacterium]|nr:hypothetical protein [Candidatus Gastranaerophilales bacterium]